MWLSFDIETYEEFNGTNKSKTSILNDCLFSGGMEEIKKQRKNFENKLIKGNLYPVLNSRKFLIGCVVTDKGEKISFDNSKKMLEWIENKIKENAKKKQKTYLFAHNLDYDMLGLIKDDFMELINTNLSIISDSPALYSWKINGKNWGFFVDSYSFFRNMSVKKIGNILGFNKLEMPETIKDKKELIEYCMRDCEVVLKGMQFLKEKMKCLGFTPTKFLTAGQVAMSTFMSSIRKDNIHWNIMKNGEVYKGKFLEKCRPAYRGARNEAFYIGKVENTTYVDINSLYPYAMTQIPFPKLDEEMFVKDPLKKGLTIQEILDKKFIGCAECVVFVPKIEIGYLPIRFGKMLHFPTGERILKGTWTTLELKKALELGYKIEKINWCCLYPVNKINVLDKFVKQLYKLRQESGEEMNLCIKMILNNLYGKFAQFRTNKEFKIVFRSEMRKWIDKGWKLISVYGNQNIIGKMNEIYIPKYTNLLIATLITAYGRDYLYNFLTKIKRDDLIYCDTDGIILKNFNKYKDVFKISKELGDWKIVEDQAKSIIKGEKNYKIGKEIKVSGVSRKVLEGIDFEKTNSVIQKRQVSLKTTLRNPEEYFNKLGSFENFEINFKSTGKQNIILPNIIDERKEWVDLFEE